MLFIFNIIGLFRFILKNILYICSMNRRSYFGFVWIGFVIVAISIFYNSGNQSFFPENKVSCSFQVNSDFSNLINPTDLPSSAECNDQSNIFENFETSIKRQADEIFSFGINRVKLLTQLDITISHHRFLEHFAQMQSNGFYLFAFCKMLI